MTTTTATTGPSPSEVDAAVRSVLSDLLGRRPNGRPSVAGGSVFAGRLLSLREAEALSPSTRLVRVEPGTVITPLARDHLKRLGVEVRFVARAEAERGRDAGEWGFAIGSPTGVLEAFRRALLDGPEAWHELGPSADDAARWVSEARSRGAFVVTDEASVAVYRACQVAGVRAATADEPGAVGRAVRALGVNVLVVEPAGKPIALLRQLGASFRRAGGPVAPDWVPGFQKGASS